MCSTLTNVFQKLESFYQTEIFLLRNSISKLHIDHKKTIKLLSKGNMDKDVWNTFDHLKKIDEEVKEYNKIGVGHNMEHEGTLIECDIDRLL